MQIPFPARAQAFDHEAWRVDRVAGEENGVLVTGPLPIGHFVEGAVGQFIVKPSIGAQDEAATHLHVPGTVFGSQGPHASAGGVCCRGSRRRSHERKGESHSSGFALPAVSADPAPPPHRQPRARAAPSCLASNASPDAMPWAIAISSPLSELAWRYCEVAGDIPGNR